MVTQAWAFFSFAPWFSDPPKVVFKEKKLFLVYLQSIRGDRKIYVLVHKYPWWGLHRCALILAAVICSFGASTLVLYCEKSSGKKQWHTFLLPFISSLSGWSIITLQLENPLNETCSRCRAARHFCGLIRKAALPCAYIGSVLYQMPIHLDTAETRWMLTGRQCSSLWNFNPHIPEGLHF
jgi:hypothetical protein